jgi:hypothetical protein
VRVVGYLIEHRNVNEISDLFEIGLSCDRSGVKFGLSCERDVNEIGDLFEIGRTKVILG